MNETNRRLVVLIARLHVGALFFLVGLGRIFITGTPTFVNRLQTQFASTPLPDVFLWTFGSSLPFVEAAVGALLLMGLFLREAFVAAAGLLVVLAMGQVMLQNFAVAAHNTAFLLVDLVGLGLMAEPLLALDRTVSASN